MTEHHLMTGQAPAAPADLRQQCRDRLQYLQALEDARKYRRARAVALCQDCAAAPDGKCNDHGHDLYLISQYEQAARQLDAELEAITSDIRQHGRST